MEMGQLIIKDGDYEIIKICKQFFFFFGDKLTFLALAHLPVVHLVNYPLAQELK